MIAPAFLHGFRESPNNLNYSRPDDSVALIDDRRTLIMRGADPLGYLGAAEAGNMHSPGRLPRQKITSLPCISPARLVRFLS
ncbi:unnamed protein product [Penicillium camemberti]|uniref:Str. FM013 n=1 Tax=Penicillium camemberti (strain FM 013) TaxID=1429867 RepID=A0A0G4PDG4_PENC3|nr:unnamed protein product [Penicillium camemberti]